MKNKVSIIVPIYKVEKYINKCIDSILKQTYKNIEIILVDDGSPDNCGEICDKYKKKDKRIKVIHKKNGGLSDARNIGMLEASGEWLIFIDSDDYIKPDYVETLLKIVKENKSEIGIISYSEIDERYIEKKHNFKEVLLNMDSKTALEVMLYQKHFDTSAWGKIYKKQLFEKIKFPKGKLYEDISTIYKVFLKSNNVTYLNKEMYLYLQRKDSIMGRSFKQKDMDYVYQAEKMYEEIKKINDVNLTKAAKCRFLNANFSTILKIGKNKEFSQERNIILSNIKKHRSEVLRDKKSRFKTKIAIILSFFHFF